MSGWDFGNKASTDTPSADKKVFTKFPVGTTHIRILDQEPKMRWIHWMPQFGRSIVCPGNCPVCNIRKGEKAAGVEPRYSMQRKFSLNVYNHGTGKLEIMDEGIQFMEDLRDIREELLDEGKNLVDAVLKVKKRMSDGKASYRIDIHEITPVSAEEQAAYNERTDMDEYFKAHPVEQILQMLEVTENHKEKFIEIVSGGTQNDTQDEQIETE